MAKILYVDDDEAMLLIVGAALRRGAGAEVITATAVAEAEAALEAGPYDLVLLDYELPGEGGLAFCRHVRGSATDAKTPVVFLSGHGEAEAELARSAGANAFLKKPLPPRALLERLSPWIGTAPEVHP